MNDTYSPRGIADITNIEMVNQESIEDNDDEDSSFEDVNKFRKINDL
jgi:hypothetical protein